MSFDLNIFGPLPVGSTGSAPGLTLCMLIHVLAVIDLFHSSGCTIHHCDKTEQYLQFVKLTKIC